MNDDYFMNDTLDNINFSQDLFIKNIASNKSSHNESQAQPKSSGESEEKEISLDDSIFLAGSFKDDICNGKENKATTICDKAAVSNHSNIQNREMEQPNEVFKCSLIKTRSENDTSIKSSRPTQYMPVNSRINTDTSKVEKKLKDSLQNETAEFKLDNAIKLSSWGLPSEVLKKYESKNLHSMFHWQVECLRKQNVLENCKNLVYAAPTSAGKTLVAEILAIKTVLDRRKKVIFILPFISIVQEKMYYFQNLLGSSGIRVEGFMGSYNPPGGFSSVQIAICTIEKANSLINRLLEEEKVSDVGTILVDEIHMLGDPSRGYLLELLLTKLLYISKKNTNINLQIIGMSATLPNLDQLANWLDAELYTTDFRPIPLYEQAHVCGEIYDKDLKLVRKLKPLEGIATDTDNILQLCLETIQESCSVLIFCPTKNWCESLAQQIAMSFCKLGNAKSEWGELLRLQLNTNLIMEVLEQLKFCPVGLDNLLCKSVSFGVAFHHAGLTMDERDIIEGAFRSGALRVLIATSTLSSGVNLPARRVIVRTPMFHGKPIDTLSYRQMIGRAGRMGKDSMGESILICQKNDYRVAKTLMSAPMRPVESCLEGAGKLKRAVLEVIASGVASSPEDIELFARCTLLSVMNENLENPVEEAVTFLRENEFIRLQKVEDGTEKFAATSKACLSSSVAPDEGLALFAELEKARQCFVLETELHLIYLVTPYRALAKTTAQHEEGGELVGVRESFLISATRGNLQTNTNKSYHKMLVHKRFFVALALQDLVNEKPLGWVCAKFNCNRGLLQSLQQSASVFAGMVTAFSRQLGWSSVELLISQFQDRMQFGVSRDLLDLMRLPILNGKIARTLYNAGIETIKQLANSKISRVEDVLYKATPFETEKGKEGESEFAQKQRNKFRNVWVTGKEGLTEREAAEMLVDEARKYLKLEMGLVDAKWNDTCSPDESSGSDVGRTDATNDTAQQSPFKRTKEEQNNVITEVQKSESQVTSNIEGSRDIEMSIQNVSSDNSLFGSETNISNSSIDLPLPETLNSHHNEQISNKRFLKTAEENEKNNGQINSNVSMNSSISTDKAQAERLVSSHEQMKESPPKRREVSDALSSCSSKELNISNSSLSSAKSTINVLLGEMQSDESLFESFNLHLSSSSSDSGIKEERNPVDEMDTMTVLQSAFSGSFNDTSKNCSSDIFESSGSELETKKRRNETIDPFTPSKKRKGNDVNDEDIPMSLSFAEGKLGDSESVDLNQIEVVNICSDMALFDLFSNELKRQRIISLSLACSRFVENKSTIGLGTTRCQTQIESQSRFVFKSSRLNGFAITWNANVVYYLSLEVPDYISKVTKLLKSILANEIVTVKIFDSKEQIKMLNYCTGIQLKSKIDDPKIADWILDPETKEKNLLAMMLNYFPEGIKLAQLAGSCKGLGSISLDIHSSVEPKKRSSIEAVLTWHLVDCLRKRLEEIKDSYLDIYDLESQTILCLSKMEINGIGVKKSSFQELEETLKAQIAAVEKKAYSLAGRRFNFTSSTDVAKVVGMFRGKKVSTRKQVLEQNDHPISDLVLIWRKLNCTLTKTFYPLLRVIESERIHGCCITHTATGRVSMHEPNLQNIPKDFLVINPISKSEITISCRKAFRARDGCALLSADYCQLELRILTHLSQDQLLVSVMSRPGDVFRSIAAKWNKVEICKVDDAMRQNTKHICYGIIYGMGAKALSEQLQIGEDDALMFMEAFKNTYPALRTFINNTIDKCRKNGYVETVTGRRRYLPNINDSDATKKGQAERQAVNTVVQGSAADIAKRAMVTVEEELQKIFCKTKNGPKIVLQLHDELIYEVPTKYVIKVAKIVKKYMEESVRLSVPFPVKLKTGPSWGDLTEYTM